MRPNPDADKPLPMSKTPLHNPRNMPPDTPEAFPLLMNTDTLPEIVSTPAPDEIHTLIWT